MAVLRGICLGILDLDEPTSVALAKIPASDYLIHIQFSRNGEPIGHGYGVKVRVVEESGRKKIDLAYPCSVSAWAG